MLQILKFDSERIKESEFNLISVHERLKFFIKRIWYVIFCVYSTIFVAAIDPFVNTKFEIWIFYAGFLLTGFILARLINHLVMYNRYSNGKIIIKPDEIRLIGQNVNSVIPANEIETIKVNLLGNLTIFHKDSSSYFPIFLLNEEDRSKALAQFEDISPAKTALYKKIHDFVDAILIAFILAMHIREYRIQAYFIPTGSMEDTLLVGDHLLVEKITYGPIIPKMIGMDKEIRLDFLGLRKIQRGDIVIFRPPNEIYKDYIKRCIAIPGDKLNIKNGAVFVNGKQINEPYTKGSTSYDDFREKKIEGTVPNDMLVVLGDNRENSYDGRGFGYLPIERVKGKAFILYWNTKQIRNLNFSRYGLIR